MRLIDADKIYSYLIDSIDDLRGQDYDLYCSIGDMIQFAVDNTPITYDIDGVVEQLKRCYGIVRSTSVDYAEGLKDAYERAIGIVEAGGINEAD